MPARALRIECLRAVMAQRWPEGTSVAELIALARRLAEEAATPSPPQRGV